MVFLQYREINVLAVSVVFVADKHISPNKTLMIVTLPFNKVIVRDNTAT